LADVFISYKSERRNAAQHLSRILELNGYSVWFDYGLFSGSDFGPQIERELRAAKAVVVLWCSLSRESRWVLEEADLATRLGTLTPAFLERVDPPLGFARADTIDLTIWDGAPRSHRLDRLLNEVARRVGRDPIPQFRGMQTYEETWRSFGAPPLTRFALTDPVAEREEERLRKEEKDGWRDRAASERQKEEVTDQAECERLAHEDAELRRAAEAQEKALRTPRKRRMTDEQWRAEQEGERQRRSAVEADHQHLERDIAAEREAQNKAHQEERLKEEENERKRGEAKRRSGDEEQQRGAGVKQTAERKNILATITTWLCTAPGNTAFLVFGALFILQGIIRSVATSYLLTLAPLSGEQLLMMSLFLYAIAIANIVMGIGLVWRWDWVCRTRWYIYTPVVLWDAFMVFAVLADSSRRSMQPIEVVEINSSVLLLAISLISFVHLYRWGPTLPNAKQE